MLFRSRSSELEIVDKVGKANTGTTIRFWPNKKYFDTNKIHAKDLMHSLKAKAVLCPGLKMKFQNEETGEKKGKLNLMWNQRSVDTALGLPFNIASYGLLLHLLAKETGYEEGKLVGHLGDIHIYENHREGLLNQLSRVPLTLPKIETDNFTSIFDWEYTDSKVIGYEPHGQINFGKPAI